MATAEHPINGSDDATGYSAIADTEAANLADAADPSAANEPQPSGTEPSAAAAGDVNPSVNTNDSEKKWPGWPGHCVFRLIVPVLKVGSIIGRKGELIKKMCEETRARIRVLDAPLGTPDRIVLISGKEELDAPLSPAMDAVIRVFKRVCGLPDSDSDSSKATPAACSIRFLVASTQAINLIGKQGSLIKSIQESTGASVRVLSEGELPVFAAADERIIDLQGEASKVLKAVEAVVGHLRKFLIDQSVLPLFEKAATHTATTQQDRPAETWVDKSLSQSSAQMRFGADYQLPPKRDLLFPELESRLDSQIKSSGLSLYGQDPGLSGLRPSRIGRAGAPIVTQVTQTMQIPLTYAEDIIGIGGANIAYIRRTSGAILTVQETRGMLDEITVEIKGSSSQVQTAQQLINEFINGHKEPSVSSYNKMDPGLRSYSQLGDTPYSSSSYTPQYGGYSSSSLGGFTSYRL